MTNAHANAIWTMGYEFVIAILCWMGGRSTILIIDTLDQTPWMIGCVCWRTCTTTTFTNSTCCWKLNQCEGFCSKLHNCANQYIAVGFKIGTSLDV
jgi:hypothetical protein